MTRRARIKLIEILSTEANLRRKQVRERKDEAERSKGAEKIFCDDMAALNSEVAEGLDELVSELSKGIT